MIIFKRSLYTERYQNADFQFKNYALNYVYYSFKCILILSLEFFTGKKNINYNNNLLIEYSITKIKTITN